MGIEERKRREREEIEKMKRAGIEAAWKKWGDVESWARPIEKWDAGHAWPEACSTGRDGELILLWEGADNGCRVVLVRPDSYSPILLAEGRLTKKDFKFMAESEWFPVLAARMTWHEKPWDFDFAEVTAIVAERIEKREEAIWLAGEIDPVFDSEDDDLAPAMSPHF